MRHTSGSSLETNNENYDTASEGEPAPESPPLTDVPCVFKAKKDSPTPVKTKASPTTDARSYTRQVSEPVTTSDTTKFSISDDARRRSLGATSSVGGSGRTSQEASPQSRGWQGWEKTPEENPVENKADLDTSNVGPCKNDNDVTGMVTDCDTVSPQNKDRPIGPL